MSLWNISLAVLKVKSEVKVTQSCPTLCDPMDCGPPGSSVHGILQARIQGWVAVPFSRGSSQPRDGIQISCIAGGVFTIWATREAPLVVLVIIYCNAKLFCPLCNSNSESLLPFTMQHDTSWTKLLCLLLLSNTSSYWTLRLEYLPSLLFSWYLLKALFYVTVVLLKCGPWTSSISIKYELFRKAVLLGPPLFSLSLCFNQMPRLFKL